MKPRLIFAAFAAVIVFAIGCSSLKERQLGAYVGDSQTKVYYKNIGQYVDKVPEERRVFFRSVDDAMKEGYVSHQEGGAEAEDGAETPAPSDDSGE